MKEDDKGQNIFTRINTKKLRERAFELLTSKFCVATIRVKNGDSFKVKVVSRTGKQISAETTEGLFDQQGFVNVIFSFDIGPEKYFMQTSANITSDRYIDVSILSDLFKLQRRQNFRVDLTDNYSSILKIFKLNQIEVDHDFTIKDLSLGGLSFDMDLESPLDISQDQMIVGKVIIPEKDLHIPVHAIVRYVNRVGSMGSGIRRAGIEFHPLDTQIENQMLEVLIEAQKKSLS
ncbi:MAG: PilZ domain-containing protein [Bdellovibrionota bacterium]|nr:PilZ domain-containing protein [Bdellovibrionota bacterium]